MKKPSIYGSLFQEWWIWEFFALGLLTAQRLSCWKTAFGCFLGESFPDVAHQKDHATDATATQKNLYRRGKSQLSRVSPRVDDSHGHLGASVQVQLVGHDWSVPCLCLCEQFFEVCIVVGPWWLSQSKSRNKPHSQPVIKYESLSAWPKSMPFSPSSALLETWECTKSFSSWKKGTSLEIVDHFTHPKRGFTHRSCLGIAIPPNGCYRS